MPDLDQDLERIQSALASKDMDVIEIGMDDVATRYAAQCREVNHRLQRCSKVLKKGLLAEAIQQAQLSPPLLDEFASLDFPERDEWALYAEENNLSVPPLLLAKLAVELNQAFAEAETMKECLCRHRLLALARAPIRRRLTVMWRLAKLDPMNPVWMKDLRQFERMRMREIENELQEAIRNDDPDNVELLYKEVTYPHWTEPPPLSLVNQVKLAWGKYMAKEARGELADLERKMTAAVTDGNMSQAKACYTKAIRLRKDAGLPANNPLRKRLELALEWVEQREQGEIRHQEWHDACERLADSLREGASFLELERLKKQVFAFGMGIPEDLENYLATLVRKRRRRTIVKWLLILLIAPLPLCLVASPIIWKHYFPSKVGNQIEKKDRDQIPAKEIQGAPKRPDGVDDVRAEVRSILRENCFNCHGGEKKNRIDNILDHNVLTTKVARNPKGKKYVAPSRPLESAIWLRIDMSDPDDRMPPRDEKKQLSDDQKRKIKSWIAEGALTF